MTQNRLTKLLGATAAVAGLFLHSYVFAQANYPNKPITVVVPASVGGSPDTIARLLASKVSESIGQPVVVETLPGASGIIGTQKVVRSAPDGYTVLFGFNQLVTMNPHLLPDMPYSPSDLQPISLLTELGYIWIANQDFPANTVSEWVEQAKANPGKFTWATTGVGSAAHLGGELFMEHTGSTMLPVPYKVNSTPDLIAGVIDLKMEPYTIAIPLVQAGRVKALAVTEGVSTPQLPDVPPMSDFLDGYEILGWQGVWAPAGTPPEIVERLNKEFVKAVNLPDIVARLEPLGIRAVGTPSAEFEQRIQNESETWRKLIEARGINPND